jgi:predicted metalloprotease with PDZ domain
MYKQRPEMGITEEEFIEAVEGATGVAIRENLLTWLNGKGDDLPFDEIFARVGLQWKEVASPEMVKIGEDIPTMPVLPKPFTGLTLKTDGGRLIVTQVEDYSPAYQAGIGADDEIIFVNSSRCTSADELDVLLAKRGEDNASELVISSDTGMVTLSLTPKKMSDFALTAREDAREEEKALLECWLQR